MIIYWPFESFAPASRTRPAAAMMKIKRAPFSHIAWLNRNRVLKIVLYRRKGLNESRDPFRFAFKYRVRQRHDYDDQPRQLRAFSS